MSEMITNIVDKHEDLRRQAHNAIAAYMHHNGNSGTIRVIHAAADWCLNNAIGIVEKAAIQMEKKA